MRIREEIARRYGFATFDHLLDVSEPLPMLAGDKVRSFVARNRNGHWFVWEYALPVDPSVSDDQNGAAESPNAFMSIELMSIAGNLSRIAAKAVRDEPPFNEELAREMHRLCAVVQRLEQAGGFPADSTGA